MEYRVLGSLEVRDGDRSIPLGGAKQRALLAVLLVNANQVVSRARLIDELWGDEPPETAVTSVQVYVSRLRKSLPDGVLITRAPGYVLEVDAERVDLQRFERLLADARNADPERASVLLREALALWRGAALAEFTGEPFALAEAARLEDLRLAAVEERIDADLALGRHLDVVGELEMLIAANPHRERLRGQLMLGLYRSGRQAEALEAYQQARASLDELGIELSEQLRQLEKQILTQDDALDAPRRETNLPVPATPLIGRTHELADVLDLVRANRLVTLTGAGGSGKTRLALQAASALVDDSLVGVWFVSLAAVTDAKLVEPTIAKVISARGDLHQFLRDKQPLLVLDNLEQLLPAVAPTIALLETKVLATSRERINITGEQEYLVPGLRLDDAVALFTQRARQLKPAFAPDEHAAEIARQLDGLPLALELAAARVKVLTQRQIVERLGDSLELLTSGARDLPERQRTMRATIEWSYNLLSNEERRLFARLGIFASTFDLQMAEAVCGATVDALQSLIEKSLVSQTDDGRLFLLQTLRAFALEHVDADEIETMRPLQLELIEAVAEPALAKIETQAQLAWLAEIELLIPDIRDVLAWSLEWDPDRTARLILRLCRYWMVRDQREQGAWVERAVAHRRELSDDVLAEILLSIGVARFLDNDPDAAIDPIRESSELYGRLGNRTKAAAATAVHAFILSSRGAHADALALIEHVIAEFRDIGDQPAVARGLNAMGVELRMLGEHDRAREMVNEAIVWAEGEGNSEALSYALHTLADVELDERKLKDAGDLYLRALVLARELNLPLIAAYCLGGLASVAALGGDAKIAGDLWGRAERIEEESAPMLHAEREWYQHILAPLANGAAFQRGYEAGRATETAAAAWPPEVWVR